MLSSARRLFFVSVLLWLAVLFIGLAFKPALNLVEAQTVDEDNPTGWLPDTEVTEVGRNAVRARDLLDFTLGTPLTDLSPVRQAWTIARNIAIALLLVTLILFGFGVMLRRTETYRIMPYLPVIVLLIVFIFFSYPITNLSIQLIDILQHYLVGTIRAKNLLTVNFAYDFIGYRFQDYRYNEAAEISLFLTRATSFTYTVMVSILFIRHIILWFLVIFSPFLSIALALPFTRNAGKIWIGEFFRWVLYGPVFAVFLRAVVIIWENGIPLAFKLSYDPGDPSNPGPYPTAISILLGGPGEEVRITNSLNYADTYAKYIIALLMLWAAIILPFILLRIFRDFIASFFKSKEVDIRSWWQKIYPYTGEGKVGPAATAVAPATPAPAPPPSPPPPRTWGTTFEVLERPGVDRATVALAREMAAAETAQILRGIGISFAAESVPLGAERSIVSLAQAEMNRAFQTQASESLNKIRYPAVISSEVERERFTAAIRELATRAARGDEQAKNVLNAAGVDYQKVLAEQGIKVAAVVGRPLGVRLPEEEAVGRISMIPTLTTESLKEKVSESVSLTVTEITRIAQLAERGDKNAIRVMNNLSPAVSAEFERVVAERVQREGENRRYQIIKEEVEKIATKAESGDTAALKTLAVVSQQLGVKAGILERFESIRSEIERVAMLAESGDERSISVMNSIATVLSEETKRDISERIEREGEAAKFLIVKEAVERVVSQVETGDMEAIKNLAEVSKTLELGFLSNRNVLINNEVLRIASLAESGDERAIETTRTLASTFGYEIEREVRRVESREGFEAGVTVVQEELIKVIHRAEAGDPEAADTLRSIITTLGPDFEAELEKKKEERAAQVSLEDYEQVKKMWLNNYRHAEVPTDLEVAGREEWLKIDIQRLSNALEKITSSDPAVKEEGLRMISALLTFVLLGNFSETEIIAYLKAKLESAKQVMQEIRAGKKVEGMEEELVEVEKREETEGERKLKAEALEGPA